MPPGSSSISATGDRQTGVQTEGVDDPSGEATAKSGAAKAEATKAGVDWQGIPVTSVDELKTETAQRETEPTFIEANWPYGVLILIPIIWFCSAVFRKRDPSFKHEEPKMHKKIDPVKEVKGRFKKAERFQSKSKKSKLTNDSDNSSTSVGQRKRSPLDAAGDSEIGENMTLEASSGKRAPAFNSETSANDGFGFDLEPESSAAKTPKPFGGADKNLATNGPKKIVGSSKRFKTHESADESSPLPEGEFSINEDDFAFDDQDSQLSLADSDADFGFDIDDEDADVLFGEHDSVKLEAADPSIESDSPLATTLSDRNDDRDSSAEPKKPGLNLVLENKEIAGRIPADGQSDSNFFELDSDDVDEQIESISPPVPSDSRLAVENERLSMALAQLKQKVETSQLDQATAQEAADSASAKVQELDGQLEDLNSQLLEANSANETLLKETGDLKQETADLKSTLKSLTDDLAQAESKFAKAEAESTAERDAIEAENGELKNANESLLAEVNSLKKELTAQLEIIKAGEENQNSSDQKVASLESELAALQTNQNELQDERDEAVAELKSLAEANDQATAELRQQLAAVTENHAADKAEVLRLSDEIQSLQGKLEQATQAAAASSDADSDIEDLRSKFKLRVAQEHRKRKAAEAQTAEAEQQRNELAKSLKQLKAKLAKVKSK